MATTMTLAELRTAVRQRADMVNSQFVTDSELTSYVNQSIFELYDLLVQKYGDNYYVANPHTFSTSNGTDQYALPSDFYKLLGVEVAVSGGQDSYITMKPFNFSARNRYSYPGISGYLGIYNLQYRLNGNNLFLMPSPQGGQTVRVWYVPKMTTLSADGDTLEGISGWTEYVIIDAAIKCMQKEESDVTVLMNQKQAMIGRIEAAAENRDAGSPATVSDQSTNGYYWGGNDGGWGGFW